MTLFAALCAFFDSDDLYISISRPREVPGGLWPTPVNRVAFDVSGNYLAVAADNVSRRVWTVAMNSCGSKEKGKEVMECRDAEVYFRSPTWVAGYSRISTTCYLTNYPPPPWWSPPPPEPSPVCLNLPLPPGQWPPWPVGLNLAQANNPGGGGVPHLDNVPRCLLIKGGWGGQKVF